MAFSLNYYDDDIYREAQGSDYAKCQGLYVHNNDVSYTAYRGNSNWWLRSQGGYSQLACYVHCNSNVSTHIMSIPAVTVSARL